MPVDARGVQVALDTPPRRVVSLVPSTTQTVFDLGAGDRLVGVTRFCDSPEAARRLPKVGGTKDADPERILALRPDLVLANGEENTADILDALEGRVPLWVAFPRDLDGAVADLIHTGRLLGFEPEARSWAARIEGAREALAALRPAPRRVACLIWRDPWFAVGGDTFVHAALAEAGLHGLFTERAERYPVVTPEELAAADPDLVILPSEPFPFRARHADELATLTSLPRERFVGVDGAALTWHGTRLVQGLATLADAVRHGFPPLPT